MPDIADNHADRAIDGFFQLDFKKDGVYLAVYPPVKNGRKVEASEVFDALNNKQIKEYSRDSVVLAVFKSDAVPVKIASSSHISEPETLIEIRISPDRMKAYIMLPSSVEENMPGKEEIVAMLKEKGIVFGLSMPAIEELINNPRYDEMICIAEGEYPVNGRNGSINYLFDTDRDIRPVILEDGKADFRDLNLIQSVKAGQVLCTLEPPVAGKNGADVTGNILEAVDGKPAVLPKGRNVHVSEDGLSLVSSIDGQVCLIDGKVNVLPTYEVPADVDNSTGNIKFVGNVIIRGNVLSGFVVEAGGNIEVWGVVEGAVMRADGDIILRRGMRGLGKGILKSGRDIVAKYIENSNIEANNDIKAGTIIHCNVKCGNKLELSGRRGLLVGGICKVGKEITAKVIGSSMSVATEVEVGTDPHLREHYKNLKNEALTIENDLVKTEQAIALLRKLESAGLLTEEKKEMLVKSIRTKVYYSTRLKEIKNEIRDLDEKLQMESMGRIRCNNFIYPGTRIIIGPAVMNVNETLQYCTVYRDGMDVKIGPL